MTLQQSADAIFALDLMTESRALCAVRANGISVVRMRTLYALAVPAMQTRSRNNELVVQAFCFLCNFFV